MHGPSEDGVEWRGEIDAVEAGASQRTHREARDENGINLVVPERLVARQLREEDEPPRSQRGKEEPAASF
jgi:hypothetical protein